MVARDVALEWSRNNAPDLRIQHGDDASGARFTYRGRTFEVVAEGDGHYDAIVARVYEALRELQGEPVAPTSSLVKARALEQQIVAARYGGQHATADALELELLALRGDAGRALPRRRVRHEGVFTPPPTAARTRFQW